MAEITLKYNARNALAKTIIELIYKSGVFQVDTEADITKEELERIKSSLKSGFNADIENFKEKLKQ